MFVIVLTKRMLYEYVLPESRDSVRDCWDYIYKWQGDDLPLIREDACVTYDKGVRYFIIEVDHHNMP